METLTPNGKTHASLDWAGTSAPPSPHRMPALSPAAVTPAQPPSADPALVQAILLAADAQYSANNLAAARDFLALLDHCHAHTPDTLQTLGNLNFLLGAYEGAHAAFQAALVHRPVQVDLWVCLAHTCLRQQDASNFERALTQALSLDPQNLNALKLLADTNLAHGQYRDAARIYARLLDRHPNQEEILLAVAKCLFELGDPPQARNALERVLSLNPSNSIAQENLQALAQRQPASGPDAGTAP